MKIRPINMIGRVVEIVGIRIGDHGRSCEEHIAHYGVVLAPDVLVRLLVEDIMVDGYLERAICVYWVTDLIERCRIGFLPRHMICYADSLDGLLAQVSEVYGAFPPR